MEQLKCLYRKYYNCITKILFPLILLIYPLVKINQGIDVSDSTYSLSNYLYFERLEGTWVISTYLSNAIGWLLTRMPFGKTLLGMNFYTGFIVSGLVLGMYYLLRRWMPDWIVFIGEFIAIGFLWIPTTILYNYLTYVLFSLGAVFLYKGLLEAKDRNLVMAGILLGLNVWVRIPNLAEMALIVSVWYYCYLQKGKYAAEGRMVWQSLWKKTGFCVAGYAAGVAVPLFLILIQYGFDGITQMITGLSAIQSGDDTYSVFSMIRATLDAYLRTGKWVVFIVMGIVMGTAMFCLKKDAMIRIKKLVYLCGIALMLRFFWGRGMFSFRYYEDYTSMYEWGMIGLYLGLAACLYLVFGKGVSKAEQLLGMMSLVIILITPLGSNNYTYQNLNNLFVVSPVTVYAFTKLFRRRYAEDKQYLVFPWKAMISVLAGMILIQSVGFHLGFVFRDGMDGTPRNTVLRTTAVVAGMKTTQKNAEDLGGLLSYLEEETNQALYMVPESYGTDKHGLEAVYYGDCPGLPFLTGIPAAIDSSWPDLDSFPVTQMEENLMELTDSPMIILRHTEPTSSSFIEKKELLQDYMSAKHYEAGYENEGYTVYQPVEP